MSDELRALAARLERYLTATGLTQEQFAVKVGVSQSTISRLLDGSATSIRPSTRRQVEAVVGQATPPPSVAEDSAIKVAEPTQPRLIKVFFACPSDVEDELETVEAAVRDLNIEDHPFRLELVSWRTHAVPGLGSGPQEVVNTSVTDDFEIFVGVMWARFGKPTERAKSGTVEEFETAYARWMKDRDAVDVMFYFKDTPLPPSRTDPRELQQVLDFKKKLADEALYWEFTDSEELGHKLRLHLLRKARQIVTRQSGHSVVLRAAPAALDGAGSEQDVGFFDLQEDALEAFQRGTESVRRLDQQTRELGSKINARTSELNAVPKKHGQPDVKAIQRIWDNVASDLEVFSERIDLELPLMSEAYRTALDRTADLTRVFMEFEVEDLTALRVLRDSSSQLATTVEGVRHHLTTFRTVVSRIPRFTKAVSKARRRAAASLDQLILELDAIVRMAGVVVESTDDCLTKIEDQDL